MARVAIYLCAEIIWMLQCRIGNQTVVVELEHTRHKVYHLAIREYGMCIAMCLCTRKPGCLNAARMGNKQVGARMALKTMLAQHESP